MASLDDIHDILSVITDKEGLDAFILKLNGFRFKKLGMKLLVSAESESTSSPTSTTDAPNTCSSLGGTRGVSDTNASANSIVKPILPTYMQNGKSAASGFKRASSLPLSYSNVLPGAAFSTDQQFERDFRPIATGANDQREQNISDQAQKRKKPRSKKQKEDSDPAKKKAKKEQKTFPHIQTKIDNIIKNDPEIRSKITLKSLSYSQLQESLSSPSGAVIPSDKLKKIIAKSRNTDATTEEGLKSIYNAIEGRMLHHDRSLITHQAHLNLCLLEFGLYLSACLPKNEPERAKQITEKKKLVKNSVNGNRIDAVFKGALRIAELYQVFEYHVLSCTFLFNGELMNDMGKPVFCHYRDYMFENREAIVKCLEIACRYPTQKRPGFKIQQYLKK